MIEVVKPSPWTEYEKQQAALFASNEWAVFRHEAEAGITTWIKRNENGDIVVRETQEVTGILEANKIKQGCWDGWKNKKAGAIVASIPVVEFNKLKDECGFDGAQFDMKHLKKKLNDSDLRLFRTGGGRL